MYSSFSTLTAKESRFPALSVARAGVPEYWIADPWSRTIEVLSLEAGSYRSLGVFEGKAVLPTQIVPDFLVHVEQCFL